MYNETRKIMHSDIEVAPLVFVFRLCAHSEATWIETERPISVEEARKAFAEGEGIILQDDPANKDYPMPLFVADKEPVYVGPYPQGYQQSERSDILDCKRPD